jgi:hypothetical protein
MYMQYTACMAQDAIDIYHVCCSYLLCDASSVSAVVAVAVAIRPNADNASRSSL